MPKTLIFSLEAQEHRTPSKAAAHAFEQEVLAFFHLTRTHRVIERQWNRRG